MNFDVPATRAENHESVLSSDDLTVSSCLGFLGSDIRRPVSGTKSRADVKEE